jgi:hypothetical protein
MFGGTQSIHCEICCKQISKNNYNRHAKSCVGVKPRKIRGVDFDPNVGYKNGTRTAWNKGLRSKPDTRNPEFIGRRGGYRPNAGRTKKYTVKDSFGNDVVLQSTYELSCSQILNELGVSWIRPLALKYDQRNYFADFYLVDHDIYLDPKNDYKAKLDADKISRVAQQNNVSVVVL